MWKCSNCKADVDDDFHICWNCGTLADGSVDPTFAPEQDITDLPADWVPRIRCEACGYQGKVLKHHLGYAFWMIAVSLGVSGLVGFLAPWLWFVSLFVFGTVLLSLGNRTVDRCPACGRRHGLQNWRGEPTFEAEQGWNSARCADDQKFAANKRNLLVLLMIVLAGSVVSLYINFRYK